MRIVLAWRPLRLLCLLALAWVPALPASGATLITTDEAKLPPSPFPPQTRGITRGPTVRIETQTEGVGSPFRLIVSFAAHGGAQIALDSVKLTYLRNPAVDLTARVKAGEVVNHVAVQVGGKGGGRADLAQAGGSQPAKLAAALGSLADWLAPRIA